MSNLPLALELEHKQLLSQIAQVERNLSLPASREVSNSLLTFLNALKTRLGVLEERQKALAEATERSETLLRVMALVERETALSEREKAQYARFLEKEHFTKADFNSLEEFYSETWDRLSEGGKQEMSHRVWEGVRREEYRFSELPETVKEKEAQRLRDGLKAGHKNLEAIPEHDREDFIDAWDDGRKRQSYEVLDRRSFAKSVAVSVEIVPDAAATKVHAKAAVVESEKKAEKREDHALEAKANRQDLEFGDLAGVSLVESDGKPPLNGHKKSGTAPVRSQ